MKLQQEAKITDLKTLVHTVTASAHPPSSGRRNIHFSFLHSCFLHRVLLESSLWAGTQGLTAFGEPEILKQAVRVTRETLDARI